MKILKLISAFFLTGLFIGLIYQIKVGKPQKNSNILVVGTSADYPPYEQIDSKSGNIVGFDIDVISQVARRLGKQLVLKDMTFASLIFGLLSGDIDVVAAGMSPTERRARLVSFTHPYLQGQPLVILTKLAKLQPKTVQDLVGKSVAVNIGYIADAYMSQQPGIHLVKLDTPANSFMALQSGTVDAFVSSKNNVDKFLDKTPNAEQFLAVPIANTAEICAFAVGKYNKKLLEEINTIIDEMIQDKTLDALKQKWNLL